jgi:hypothetical protein
MFGDISNFSDTSDYLPLLNGILFTEVTIIFLTLTKVINTKVLIQWYRKYGIFAIAADVLIVMIGAILTRFFYPFFFSSFNLFFFILLGIIIQCIHDVTFYYLFVNIPRGVNKVFDTFKDYASEVKGKAILGNSAMIIFSFLFASMMKVQSLNANIISLVCNLYFYPYTLYIN